MMFDLLREPSAERKVLRPHQALAIEMLRKSLERKNRRVVIQGPVGFGKTLVASKIIEGALSKGNRVIFTAPAISLIDQTVDRFEDEGIEDIGVIQANHPRTNSLAQVQVATVQSLAKRDIPKASLVIVDECHLRASVIDQMMDENPDVFFVGLSATPWAKGMGLRWQDLVIPCTTRDLIRDGYLSEFRAFAPDVPDLSNIKTVAGDYHEGQLADVMAGQALMANVVETWLAKGQNRPTFCFAVNRAHAAQLHEQFERAGIAAGYVDMDTDRVEMKLLEQQFVAGEIKVMCSVVKMTTGIDWPVSCIIDAGPTKSEIRHVQKIGRGLRVNPGTEDLLILDHAGNSLRLGLATDIHHAHLDKTEKGERQERKPTAEKLPKECANCGTLHVGKVCPCCGHERKPVAGVDTVDGDLVEIGGRKSAPTMAEKQAFWSMALHLDRSRQKGGKLAKGLYKGKFGVWPKGLHDEHVAPDKAFLNYAKSRQIAYAKRMEAQRGAR